jgi:phosphatidylinositol-3-phosphatase
MNLTRTTASFSRRRLLLLLAAVLLALTALAGWAAARPGSSVPPRVPDAHHVFVVNLENKGFDETWGPASTAPYLSQTLRAQGVLLTQYYGIAHNSLGNYIGQLSGQGPNPQTQSDCQIFTDFVASGTAAPGQAVGQGCVYPSTVATVADQLQAKSLSWKGYMEDMGTPCRHPALGAVDDTQKAEVGDQYAARHNPFVYFHSIIDSPSCAQRNVDLSALTTDLASASTTPSLSYITPNLCNDAHDAPCVDGQPGGLVSADAWLRTWIPRITSSPAFRKDGVLVITFDESDSPQSDASACCGEGAGPNTPAPGVVGPGGGRVGALVISRFVRPGTSTSTPYNHYSLLASVEELFGLPRLGYAAAPGLDRFGRDVYTGHW